MIGLNAFVGGLRKANLVLLHDALVARMGIGQSVIPWTAVSGVRLDTVTGRGLTQTFLAVAYDHSRVGVREAPFERWQRLVDRGSPSELRVAEALLSIQADEAALAIARLHAIPELRRHVGTPAGLELLRG